MYPHISYLAQSYFHQDFDLEAETPLGVVQVFRDGESADTVEALRAEIVALLESEPTEEALANIWLDEAGAEYDPRFEGVTLRDWLRSMAETLTAEK
ncbi:contact-dependent growth inhibition system immunity protein [Streptomyces sp. NPDC056462]|uniref:contact-dependent growth inhibition system immunity protein n=1 Tax=Streptomyces sp. NPDC056462 TaxID=3345826 RepID=UPI003676203D